MSMVTVPAVVTMAVASDGKNVRLPVRPGMTAIEDIVLS